MKILDHQAEHHDPGLLRQTISSYINLIKPHVTVLLLGTTVAAMAIAKRGLPDLGLILATLVAGTMAAGSANCINCYIDRDIDQLMTRTRRRSLPAGKVQPAQALIFGLILGVGSFVVFTIFVNLLCACLGLAAILFYVFIYTLWLKRSSTQNIVIGGAAGAVPVLIGWAAISNSVPLAAIWLFAIIFYWTPPHFWALSLLIEKDYARALNMLQGTESPAAAVPKTSAVQLLADVTTLIPPDAKVTIDQLEVGLDRISLKATTDSTKQVDTVTAALKKDRCFKEVQQRKVERTRDGQKVNFGLEIQVECPADNGNENPQG